MSVASHSITAVFTDGSSYGSSTSAALSQVVDQASTSTVLAPSVNPSVFGQSVTFTATVTGNSPTGTVQFKDGATNLGAPAALTGNSAALSTSSLTAGTHSITANYVGNANFGASTSPVVSESINQH